MDYVRFLSRFDGRIGRARYWFATLVIMAAMVIGLSLLSDACDLLGIASTPLSIDLIGISAGVEPRDGDVAAKAGLFPQIVAGLMGVVFAWFYGAASIKRLHDRNRSGWWMLPFLIATGFNDHVAVWFGGSTPVRWVGFALHLMSVWGIVELYFLRGTHGLNRFGADPLASISPDPPAASHWDQQSEREFVPYSAGPSPGAHVKRGHD
jgi:uncharacterized membrane protein YhaH (DUF805 family)